MNSILSGLAGAGILAVAAGLGWLAWKAWGLFRSLTQSFTRMSDGIAGLQVTNGEMLKGFGEVAVQMRKLSGELEFLRTVMVAGTPQKLNQRQERRRQPYGHHLASLCLNSRHGSPTWP